MKGSVPQDCPPGLPLPTSDAKGESRWSRVRLINQLKIRGSRCPFLGFDEFARVGHRAQENGLLTVDQSIIKGYEVI